MSHVTTIELQESYDIQALRRMCLDKGWKWKEGQRTYRWYGQHVGDYPMPAGFTKADMGRCDHTIRIPGASYEVGVVNRNGEWKLLWDFYSRGGLQKVLGKNAGVLKQAYGMAKTRVTAARHRKRCYQRPAQQAGWTRLVVEV